MTPGLATPASNRFGSLLLSMGILWSEKSQFHCVRHRALSTWISQIRYGNDMTLPNMRSRPCRLCLGL